MPLATRPLRQVGQVLLILLHLDGISTMLYCDLYSSQPNYVASVVLIQYQEKLQMASAAVSDEAYGTSHMVWWQQYFLAVPNDVASVPSNAQNGTRNSTIWWQQVLLGSTIVSIPAKQMMWHQYLLGTTKQRNKWPQQQYQYCLAVPNHVASVPYCLAVP